MCESELFPWAESPVSGYALPENQRVTIFIHQKNEKGQQKIMFKCSSKEIVIIFPFQPPAPAPVVDEAPPSKKPTRLAIGMEDGFDGGVEKVEYEESYSLLVLPEFTIIPLPDPQLPQKVCVGCLYCAYNCRYGLGTCMDVFYHFPS